MRYLVFVSLERWDQVWRRNQFLCAGLAERFPDSKILFVEPARDFSHQLRSGSLSALREPAFETLDEFPNIILTRPLKLWPNSFEMGRKQNQAAMQRHLRKALKKFEMEEPLLWLNPHDAGHLAGTLGECAVVYDITDDWTLTELSPGLKALVCAQDEYLCARADLTIVCSQALYESRRGKTREILHLPNGVHVERYSHLEKLADKAPQWSAPVFGYVGTLHPERTDVSLIEALAHEFPQGTVALVGPDHFDAASRRKLEACGNVELTGPVPYSQVPQHMASFDVCIVPHHESAFVESLNPLKLWEYLACGKPIASTDVAGFRDFGTLCHIGSGPHGFVQACYNALAEKEDEQTGKARQALAAPHSWDARLDVLLESLQKLEAK